LADFSRLLSKKNRPAEEKKSAPFLKGILLLEKKPIFVDVSWKNIIFLGLA
jgi:hypothetical protein